ncbi:MAG TPA: ScpA family protein [Gammaproteobacteria bacterium]|nr:ScpA family protein [Gammaproteobacteria bacterium]
MTDKQIEPGQDLPGEGEVAAASADETTFAIVQGTVLTRLPRDLYIPPDALEVFLDTFEGPLDLLLYLIKRQNLDILDIPIAQITRQYMVYVEAMKDLRLELAAEYLVMAAMLAEIKSRMLLPRHADAPEEEDPRAELVRRLQEYERYKQAAEDLNAQPQLGRDIFQAMAEVVINRNATKTPPTVSLDDLLHALKEVLARAEMFTHHHIQREPLSVREHMSQILSTLDTVRFTEFTSLFIPEEGRGGIVVTLLALLELIKESLVELVQAEAFGPIHVRVANTAHDDRDVNEVGATA